MIVPRKPAGQNFDGYNPPFDDEIDLSKLWIRVLRNKGLAVLLALLGAVIGTGVGFQRGSQSTPWSAASKTTLNEAIGSVKGVGTELVAKELVPWREADEVKKSLEGSLTLAELTKLMAGQQMEILNTKDLEKDDLKIPVSLERLVRAKTREGRKLGVKFSYKFTGKLNELPATLTAEASQKELAPRMLNAWLEKLGEDLKQKKQPFIQKGLKIAHDLKAAYEKEEPKTPSLRSPSLEASGGKALAGSTDTSKVSTAQVPMGATVEFDPKLGSVETAIRVLNVMLETPVIQASFMELNKGVSLLKQTVLGGVLGAFLGLGFLGGVLLLQSLRGDVLETENELASIFPESAVLTLGKTQPLKAVSKTVLWAAWVHAGADTEASPRDFVLWQAGGGDLEAISEMLIQEYRIHYPGLAVTTQSEPLPQTLQAATPDPVSGAREGLYVLSALVSVESLRLVRKTQKYALVINETQPSLSAWRQRAAALELSGIRPNLVVLLS